MNTPQLKHAPAGANGVRRTDEGRRAVAHFVTDSDLMAQGRQISALLEAASHLETLHCEEADRYARLALWHAEQATRARRERARLERLACQTGSVA